MLSNFAFLGYNTMAASHDEERFGRFAEQLEKITNRELDPQLVDIELAATCLSRLHAIERLGPNPPALKNSPCLRVEIDTLLQGLKNVDEPQWDEATRKQFYESQVAILDTFIESDHTATEGLDEVAKHLRLVIAGFENYRAKVRQ